MEEGRKLYLIYAEHEGGSLAISSNFTVERYLDLIRTGYFIESYGELERTIRPFYATLVGEIWEFTNRRLAAERELIRGMERGISGSGSNVSSVPRINSTATLSY